MWHTLDEYIESLNRLRELHGGGHMILVFDRTAFDLESTIVIDFEEKHDRRPSEEEITDILDSIDSLNMETIHGEIDNAVYDAVDNFEPEDSGDLV